MEQIKNDQLTVEISAHGAELKSIKDAKEAIKAFIDAGNGED